MDTEYIAILMDEREKIVKELMENESEVEREVRFLLSTRYKEKSDKLLSCWCQLDCWHNRAMELNGKTDFHCHNCRGEY